MDKVYTMVNGDKNQKRFFSGNFGWKIYWENTIQVYKILTFRKILTQFLCEDVETWQGQYSSYVCPSEPFQYISSGKNIVEGKLIDI